MKRFFLRTVITAVALAAVGIAQAQTRELKIGTQNPKGHPIVTGAEKFAELVAAKSGGKLKVNIFPGGQLGGDAQTISAVQGGTVDFSLQNSGILASQVKDFEIYDFPFLFANPKEVDAIVDGEFGRKLHAKLQDKGMLGLAYFELGFRNITNSKRPINTVADLEGLKLRVIPNAINVDWVKAVGANPTPMAFPEVYAGLESKAIDGQENPLTVINANKFFEVQKHLALTGHQYNPQSLIVSKKTWDSLSADEKKAVQDSATEAGAFQRKINRELMDSNLDALKKAGMQVTSFSPEEQKKMQDKMKPVLEKHGGAIAATLAEMQAELAKQRK
jgi:tripartite ATP-independent transporter DctP family solute receptor